MDAGRPIASGQHHRGCRRRPRLAPAKPQPPAGRRAPGTGRLPSRWDAVAICDSEGQRIACGIANYGSAEVEAIRGLRSDRIEGVLGHEYGAEIVHRDNMLVLM